MRSIRAVLAAGGTAVALLAAAPAPAATSQGEILMPCVTPATRYSETLNAYTLPNGVCAWSTSVPGEGAFSLELGNTDAADLDVYFYDASGSYLDADVGGGVGFCGSFGGEVPAAARLAVVTFAPGCPSTAAVAVTFTFSY